MRKVQHNNLKDVKRILLTQPKNEKSSPAIKKIKHLWVHLSETLLEKINEHTLKAKKFHSDTILHFGKQREIHNPCDKDLLVNYKFQ